MAKRADPSKTFTESFAIIRADDTELEATLREDEARVEQSVGNMQADFNKLDVSVTSTGNNAQAASQTFGALGAQMSAVGGIAGNVGGKVAGLGSAFVSLGSSVLGLPGLVLAASAALGILITKLVSAREETERLKQAEFERQQLLASATDKEITSLRKLKEANEQLRAALGGPGTVAMRAFRAEQIELIRMRGAANIELRRLATESTLRTATGATPGEEVTRQFAITRQRQIVEEANERLRLIQQRHNNQIEDLNERRRQKELQREKAASAERQDILRRELAMRQTALASFEATPAGQVAKAIRDAISANRQRAGINAILDSPLFGLLPDSIEQQVRDALGFGLAGAGAGRGGPGGGGVSTAEFGGGPIVTRAGFFGRERLEEKRTEDIAEIKKGIFSLVSIWKTLGFGAQ